MPNLNHVKVTMPSNLGACPCCVGLTIGLLDSDLVLVLAQFLLLCP